jgi:hypothetical protein
MNGTSTLSPVAQMTVNKMTGDMKFVGIFYIVVGAIYCLTIVGAVIGIPFIICGLRLRESSDAYNGYLTSNDAGMLERAFERQGSFFFIQKVLLIIGLVLMVIYIIFIIAFSATLFSSMGGNFNSY